MIGQCSAKVLKLARAVVIGRGTGLDRLAKPIQARPADPSLEPGPSLDRLELSPSLETVR